MSKLSDTRFATIDKPQEMEQARGGPVKTTLDLSCFIRFSQEYQGRRGKWIKVGTKGEIYVSHEVGKELPENIEVEFLLNRKGTILVMRECRNGLRMQGTKNSKARRTSCAALKNILFDLGIKLPVRFTVEWDNELQAWVGRR